MDLDQLELLPDAQGKKNSAAGAVATWLRMLRYKASTPQFWIVLLIPWVTFVVTFWMFTHYFMGAPYVCCAFTFGVLVIACIYMLWEMLKNMAQRDERKGLAREAVQARNMDVGSLTITVFGGVFFAVVFGTFLGLFNYDTFAIFPLFYDHTRQYTNVVASQPAQAVSDAGRIKFNHQTIVNVDKSIGLVSESGSLYCVAPITAAANQARIEYWAAGINCCTVQGGFHCDAADNPQAGGGVRIFDNNQWFAYSRFHYYEEARAKAEAEYSLQSVSTPIFVRWVEKSNLNYLHDYYHWRAILFFVAFAILFFCVFGLASAFLWKPW